MKKDNIKNKTKIWILLVIIFFGFSTFITILADENSEEIEDFRDITRLSNRCYYTGQNPDELTEDILYGKELYCFTDDNTFYVVTKANNQYYNDVDMTNHYEFTENEDGFSLSLDGEAFSECSIENEDTFKCSYVSDINSNSDDNTYRYIEIDNLGNLEEYPIDESTQLVFNNNTSNISYRPLDPVFSTLNDYIDDNHRIINWEDNIWAILPSDMNNQLANTGMSYNDYVEEFCLYEIKVDDVIVKDYNSFIPFGAKQITITQI